MDVLGLEMHIRGHVIKESLVINRRGKRNEDEPLVGIRSNSRIGWEAGKAPPIKNHLPPGIRKKMILYMCTGKIPEMGLQLQEAEAHGKFKPVVPEPGRGVGL